MHLEVDSAYELTPSALSVDPANLQVKTRRANTNSGRHLMISFGFLENLLSVQFEETVMVAEMEIKRFH